MRIDGYDDAVLGCRDPDGRRRILRFIDGMLEVALKGNENLRLAVIMGTMRVSRGGACSRASTT